MLSMEPPAPSPALPERGWFAALCVILLLNGTLFTAWVPAEGIERTYMAIGIVLPAPTVLLLNYCGFVRSFWWGVVPAHLGLAWGLWSWRPRRGRALIDLAAAVCLLFMWYLSIVGLTMPAISILQAIQ